MATRSVIKIEGVEYAKVYKHWDGNPTSTLPWLIKFNKNFTSARGADPQYKFAQLLRASIIDAEEFNLGADPYTGWGVIPYYENYGEEYEYILKSNGDVDYIHKPL